MKKEYNLAFSFKGKRDYVQGPDILDAALKIILSEYGQINDIKYSAHGWIRNNGYMIIQNDPPSSTPDSLVTFSQDDSIYYCLINDDKTKIVKRHDYSEEKVVSESEINGNQIRFVNQLPYSLSEIIVSMNKHYLQSTVKSEGKWIVTKLEYLSSDNLFDIKGKALKIELLKNLNNKLTKSEVYIDNVKIGYVYFSLV